MFAPAGMAAKAIAINAFLGGVLSACSDDPSIMDDDSIVVGGFVASPVRLPVRGLAMRTHWKAFGRIGVSASLRPRQKEFRGR